MNVLSHGLSWIDLQFQGRPRVIATGLVHGPSGAAIVDPGPASCLHSLDLGLQESGIRWSDVRHVLLTHVHLDHAGATGTIVAAHPHISVLVHERGARHLADPSRLIDSARRIYGEQMDRFWGEVAPVPTDRLVALTGGERVEAGGRTFDVAYTPGHASHHVSYFDASSGVALVGDVAGVCIDGGYVLPPTPPPDIDLGLWEESVRRVLSWSPSALLLTHFGPVTRVGTHLSALMANLQTTSALARALLDRPGTDEERSLEFAAQLRNELRHYMTEAEIGTYIVAASYEHLFSGLARYWRKKAGSPA